MNPSQPRIRSEILVRLKNGIRKNQSKENISLDLVEELASRLVHIDNPTERKGIIKSWYGDIKSADTLRKHHLNYYHPSLNRELHSVLNDVTIKFRKRFYNYFS